MILWIYSIWRKYSFWSFFYYKNRGFVCFKNKHYVYAGYMNKTWIIVNDETVINLGSWEKLKNKLAFNFWFPSLLFYEDIDQNEENSK